MKEFKKYFYWALAAIGVVFISIIIFFAFFRISSIMHFARKLLSILMPFVYGLMFAYLLLPIFNACHKRIQPWLKQKMKNQRRAEKYAKMLCTAITMFFLIFMIVLLIWLVIPQVVTSIIGLTKTLPANIYSLSLWVNSVLEDNPEIAQMIMSKYDEVANFFANWLQTEMIPQLTNLMDGLWSTITFVKNIFIGLFICIYVLNSKELFAAQAKKLTYSCMNISTANLFVDNIRFVHKVFGGFINGKLLDSAIIGVICFLGMSILQLPYAVLISVIIGVTNIIPFFGPFIGAIPSVFLIILVSPVQALYFIIFILLLQQLDGNIIGPKILGGSTGLSSFWVMFAILVFGGLFGFAGMVIGVPIFAVLYSLIASLVNHSLRRKALTPDTKAYYGLDHIESDTYEMCYDKREPQTSIQTRRKPVKKRPIKNPNDDKAEK